MTPIFKPLEWRNFDDRKTTFRTADTICGELKIMGVYSIIEVDLPWESLPKRLDPDKDLNEQVEHMYAKRLLEAMNLDFIKEIMKDET